VLAGQAFDDARSLERVIKGSESFSQCMARTVYSYALGRSAADVDKPTLATLTQHFVDSNGDLPGLLADVATSSAFTQRCPSSPGAN
jgi:hypothetical protein